MRCNRQRRGGSQTLGCRDPGPGRVEQHERESGSRAYLDLPGNQEKLLEVVAAVGKPTALIVFSGRPLILNWAAKQAPAMLEA